MRYYNSSRDELRETGAAASLLHHYGDQQTRHVLRDGRIEAHKPVREEIEAHRQAAERSLARLGDGLC